MARTGEKRWGSAFRRLAFPRPAQRLERAFQSQTLRRPVLPFLRPECRSALHRTPQRRRLLHRLDLFSTTNTQINQTSYAYNATGLLTSTTDADGRIIDYGYDAAGEKTSETWVSGSYTATYQYNDAGELTNASDPSSTYSYTYDAAGQLSSVDNAGTLRVPTVTLSYGYDAYGDRTSLSDSLGGSISYTFAAVHNLTGLALTANSVTSQVALGYDAANRLTGITRTIPTVGGGASPDTGGGGGGGNVPISTSLSYDNANRLTNITHSNGSTGATLASYTYGYDKASELTSYQDNSNSSLSYTYDANGELTGASGTLNGSNYSVSYSYDANGNRNMSGYQTGTGNELLNDGTYSYTYDKDGNLATQTNISTGSVTSYTWDYRNRLTEVEEKISNGTVVYDEKFTYDVNNNRIAVSLNGTTQLYTVYDGANPYMDFNGSGSLSERYLFNPQALSVFYGQVSGSGTTEWFLTDNINSIRQVVSTAASALDAITYDPYGNILNQTSTTYEPRFLYAGGAYDSNTGNYQFDARPYGPSDGRLITQDWAGLSAGNPNLYGYVFNSPLDETDPSGMYALGLIRGANPNNFGSYVFGSMWTPAQIAAFKDNLLNSTPVISTAGAWGGALEGTCIGVGAGTVAGGLTFPIFGPFGIIGGFFGGGIAGGIYGYNKGKYQPSFMEGDEAAGKPSTTIVGGLGGLAGATIVGGTAKIISSLRPGVPTTPVTPTASQPATGIGQLVAGKAPNQVQPGIRVLEGQYVNDLGQVQPWRAHYDQFGRLIARTDFNAGNAAAGIPNVHHHTYQWGPGMNPLETGSHIPGGYVP